MKIISFGDIHEDTSNLVKIKSDIETADLILISGDLTNCHGEAEAKKVLEAVKKYNTHLLVQHGNMDRTEVDNYLTKEGINLHGNGYIFENIGIFGCGGSSPTPFHTPSEISEADIERYLTNGYNKVKVAKWKIMVCHTPPRDTLTDIIRNGIHVGSITVRNFIMKHKPNVCITGHIHESKGKDKLGDTVVLNAGMFRNGWYIEIAVNKNDLSAVLKSYA
ncbi:MAG: metallophosphoesterase family protein [Planctomycetota bacterium]|nr:metallophosphoesterase family protein [Planctomycetota bacterium]MDE1889081.1 metallophosphoesterase family protein [Planctomycetota bacterium]MDE2216496.1 metallophosphoesterase family protein [Planctomycetota bacterium]